MFYMSDFTFVYVVEQYFLAGLIKIMTFFKNQKIGFFKFKSDFFI